LEFVKTVAKRINITMLLADAKCGDKVKILRFLGDDKILKKIEAMGMRKDDEFEVTRIWGRNYLLQNGIHRFVISYEIAKSIEVELLGSSPSPCKYGRGCKRRRWRWGWPRF